VIRIESNGEQLRHGRPVLSRAGAMGLMQLMPATWHDMRSALGLGPDPHDPANNILAGTLYLRLLYDRFGYPGLFGAYNAGPTRYAAYLTGAHALPSETRAYLAATAAREPARARETGTLFVVTTLGAISRRTASRSLFVALSGSQSR
jgi:soluble lytic murein transglycosylase-like protein